MRIFGNLARAAVTLTVRNAIVRGLEEHPDADLAKHADRQEVCNTILEYIAEATDTATAMGSQLLSRGFNERDNDENPFE